MHRSKTLGLAASAIAAAAAAATMLLPASAQASTSTAAPVHASISAAAPGRVVVVSQPGLRGATPAISERTVSPRVDCGGFNGHIAWDYQGIHVWGELWDSCGSTAYLYVSYKDPFGENFQIGNVSKRGTVGIDWQSDQTGTAPGYISATVCSNHVKWHCGTPQQV
jgi:hypothetical protein